MAQRGGWKTGLLYVGVGCLSVIVLLILVVGITLVWATSTARRLGEPTPEPIERTVVIADPVAGAAQAAVSEPGASGREALRLAIELQDGSFVIRTGPPGNEVKVDGAYAKAYYELTEEHVSGDAPGGPSTVIRLRPTSWFLVRMIASLRARSDSGLPPNNLTVIIPEGVPIALTLQLRQGESEVDLGGLTLTDLDADLSMGDHRLDFSEPLAEELRRVQLNGQMGNVELDNLGNTRALEIDTSSSMGNFTADLGGDWRPGTVTELFFDHSMGDLRLRIPTTVRIAADSDSSVRFGESSRVGGSEEPDDPEAPVLKLHLSTTMGETRITRY